MDYGSINIVNEDTTTNSNNSNNNNSNHKMLIHPTEEREETKTKKTIDGVPFEIPRSIDEFLEEAYESSSTTFSNVRYWFIILSLGLANSSDASEILSLSFVLADPTFETQMLHGDTASWRTRLLTAAIFFGMLVGGLVAGNASDLVGRHKILLCGLVCNAITGLCSALTTNVIQFSILRAIAGIGIGASIPPLFTLVAEVSPKSQRGFCVTIIAAFWMVGSLYIATLALLMMQYLQTDWRLFYVACAIPATISAILVTTIVPQSPRYWALQHQPRRALQQLQRLANSMSYTGPLLTMNDILYHYPPPPTTTSTTKNNTSSTTTTSSSSRLQIVTQPMKDFLHQTLDLYRNQSMRRTTIVLQVLWASICFGSYGMSVWIYTLFQMVHLQNIYYNALVFNLANLPANIISLWLMDRVGRRNMLLMSAFAAAIALLVCSYFSSFAMPSTTGVIVSASIYQGFTTIAWNAIDTISSEHFPTSVRSSGMGLCSASGRVSAMMAQIVNASIVNYPSLLLMISSISLLITGLAPFFLPRTDMANESLSDTIITDDEERTTFSADEDDDHDDDDVVSDVEEGSVHCEMTSLV